ncbi:MAG: YeeE/YedE family protein [Flavobacteriaceae bacterium]|nr:YeeE/YedE family protein [Flavobacteriaceae bacterium]
MLSSILTGILTGMGFGIVLYKVGAIRHSRVIAMLLLKDPKILKFSLSCVAFGALIYGSADIFGFADVMNIKPRVMPFLGWAHLIGGIIFGVTMGLTGLCPGTGFVQAGSGMCVSGKRSPVIFATLGLLAGVIAFAFIKTPMIDAGLLLARPVSVTLHDYLGISYGTLAISFGLFLLLVVLFFEGFAPKRVLTSGQPKSKWSFIREEWSWVAGGLGMAIMVVISSMQDQYAGFSGCVLNFLLCQW